MNLTQTKGNKMKKNAEEKKIPAQHQEQKPGKESVMTPTPISYQSDYKGSEKLKDQVAIITGGDSGIGRSVAIYFAKEGADCVIAYLNEHSDAEETKRLIEESGRKCILIAGDIKDENFCKEVVNKCIEKFGKLNILVNNAADQTPQKSIEDITSEQWENTFKTNIFAYFYLTKAAYRYLKMDARNSIINTTSVTAYRGSEYLLDYSATKGAIVSFTRSLALMFTKDKIRVNAVAPGPIWTPLIPATFHEDKVESFGSDVPLKRAGQPCEVAPCFVFLASQDSSYMTGQVLHPNGGEIINT